MDELTVKGVVDMGIDMGADIIGLEKIDQSQLTDMDDDVNLLVYIRDDGESELPSIKYGAWLQAVVYLAVVLVACFMVFVLVYCSKRQEDKRNTRSQGESKKRGQIQCLRRFLISFVNLSAITEKATERKIQTRRSSLQCRPWSHQSQWIQPTVEITASFSMQDFSARTATMGESSGTESDSDIEEGAAATTEQALDPPDAGDESAVCQLCSKAFELGQPVYESNNPQCKHIFHMVCMDKWLNVQNTCPTCNHAYAIHSCV